MLSTAGLPLFFMLNVGKHQWTTLRLADRTSSICGVFPMHPEPLPFYQAVTNTHFFWSSITLNAHFSCGIALYWFMYASFPAKWHTEAKNLYYSTFNLECPAQYVSIIDIQWCSKGFFKLWSRMTKPMC